MDTDGEQAVKMCNQRRVVGRQMDNITLVDGRYLPAYAGQQQPDVTALWRGTCPITTQNIGPTMQPENAAWDSFSDWQIQTAIQFEIIAILQLSGGLILPLDDYILISGCMTRKLANRSK